MRNCIPPSDPPLPDPFTTGILYTLLNFLLDILDHPNRFKTCLNHVDIIIFMKDRKRAKLLFLIHHVNLIILNNIFQGVSW